MESSQININVKKRKFKISVGSDDHQNNENILTKNHKTNDHNKTVDVILRDEKNVRPIKRYTNEEKKFIADFPKLCGPHKYVPAIMSAKKRIIVFGDIHGDYQLTIEMLTAAKLISINESGKIQWIAGDTYVVQV